MTSLIEAISRLGPFRALVVGDLMLDELLYGDADRLSNDAPVPVLHVRRSEHRPGGAANVCLNLIAMGGEVSVFGVTGDDEEGRKLRDAMVREGVGCDGLVVDASRPTTVKRSLIGLAQHRHPQKMFRVDFESTEPLVEDAADRLLAAFDAALADADVVCIEDYNKGVCSELLCQEVISRARAAGKAVLVDPASISDYARYRGATCITPNRTEAEKATGMRAGSMQENSEIARTLLDALDLESVVVTLDRHGALLLERGEEAVNVPTVARQVYDVTGAGDMVLAGLAASVGCGLDWLNAVGVANVAAGLEVEIFGVEPIPLARIRHEVLKQSGKLQGKLRSAEQARLEADVVRKTGGKVVFTNGCFDIIHAGHIAMLEKSASHGAMLVVGLNDDDSVKRLKGPTRPVNTLEDRARVLGALGCVDAVVPFGEDTPIRLIDEIKPDVLIKGADYTRETVVGHEIVESYGGSVVLIDLVEGKSTTGTIERMKAK
ncbi:MAG: D-glycero-beta-D-manno-heptose 1-phosphate adenylyltransferase [Phycisphaerales bacterium]|nr:D-glycero-beta-D-manno-heptose 1-phosphate adenylyltransferase [Phycisphaerales bacterium]MCB9836888.1 D-glycero-beta-D-manno-heptose 1-phosphate adenylyltransferase [Phycisphaera sp.]